MRRRFRPGLVMTLITLTAVAAFVSLGRWQLERGEYKRRWLDAVQAAKTAPPSPLQWQGAAVSAPGRFAKTGVSGRWLADQQLLLDGQVHDRQAGYHVLTPLQLHDGALLLVNRGWLPAPARAPGATLPIPALPLLDAAVSVSGLLVGLPQAGLRMGPPVVANALAWPKVINYPTREEYQALFEAPVLDRMLWLAPAHADGLVREWAPKAIPPERHTGYAVQWFSLAATAILLFILLNFRRSDD